MSVNKVILVGNVGKDPETRYLDEGTAITKFPMATSETYRNRSGERVSTTEWHNIVLWRGLAQVAEKYVKKGTQIYIEGRTKTRSYDDTDGNRKYITEIVGDQMQLLGRRPDDAGEPGMEDDYMASSGQGSGQGQNQGQAASRPAQGTPPPASGSQGTSSSTGGGQGPSQAPPDADDPFASGDNSPDDLPF